MIGHLATGRKVRCPRHPVPVESLVMPIHLRAEPGDYAEAVLLPGDPLRARHIAETFFDTPRQVNSERGMLGFTGTFEGKPVSVQSSGMGCPSAAIVIEELVQLGAKRIVRVGTCGGLQADMSLGDLVLAISAVPSDGTSLTYTGGEPHAPTADFELVHAAVHRAKHDGTKLRVGPCVSSGTFYDPDTGRAQRWSERGVLAVEMEAAILFTIAALRRIQAACLLTVSDIIVKGEFVRITDAELQAAVERMTELGIRTALSEAKS
jgi:DeoD family purine-nucleoside phosphorylase